MTEQTPTPSTRRSFAWLGRYFDRTQPQGLRRTLLYLAAVVLLIFFGFILESFRHSSLIHSFDTSISQFADSHRTAALTWVFRRITSLASTRMTVLLVALWAATLAVRRRPKLAVVLVIGAALQGSMVYLIKHAVGRIRPSQALALVHETSFSFPSGHTMVATVVWGLAAYFAARSLRASRRYLIGAVYLLGVIAVACSRVYLGAHYPSDVTGSILLGGALLTLYLAWMTGHPKHLPTELFGREALLILASIFSICIVLAVVLPHLF